MYAVSALRTHTSRLFSKPSQSLLLVLSRRQTHSTAPLDLAFDRVSPSPPSSGAVVILHGLFGSKKNWGSLSKALSKNLNKPVYSLDLRNHGSSPHAEPMNYSVMASDVLHFCQSHHLTNISLIGHSMGGKVAMSLALKGDIPSGFLSDLIIVDIAPSKGALSPEFRTYIDTMQEIEKSGVTTRKEAHSILSNVEQDSTVRNFLLTNLLHVATGEKLKFRVPLNIISKSIGEIGSFPYEPGEKVWTGKTMFVKGTQSHYINHKNLPTSNAFFPQMILKTLDTNHWVHAEKPFEFLDLIGNFISNTAP